MKSARWANDRTSKGSWRAWTRRIGAAGVAIAGDPRACSCAIVDEVVDQGRLFVAGSVVRRNHSSPSALGFGPRTASTADVKQVQGGPLAMVALTNREAQFAGVASTDPVVGWDKGIKTLTISAFTGALDMQIDGAQRLDVASRPLAKEHARRQAEGAQGSSHRRIDHRRRARAIHALSGDDRSVSTLSAT